MDTIGTRELRQNATDYLRAAERGEEFTITASGRPVARLTPLAPGPTWRTWADVAALFNGTDDPTWPADRDLVDHAPNSQVTA